MCGSSTFCNASSFSRNSWYILRMEPNCDWHSFRNSVWKPQLELSCGAVRVWYLDHKYAHQSVQALTPGHHITTFALIQRFVVATVQTTSQGDQSIIASSGGPNEVSGRLHGKQRLISIKISVVLCGRLLDAVEFGNRSLECQT
ncbi:hypothetical protein T07_5430 [Trichinella nelsoni]|uniref:Uncharacterized protein n=1 Tax=Trichinella nelsoni TaxID=6336 RepID=A0A0V0RCV8_9BILA|nr:hypothetical protein T07_5430 [Trichinella nelsoni]